MAKPIDPGHTLGLHMGQVLYRLANTYDTLMLTLVETAQNAIDAWAKNVFIGIDVRGRKVVVYDDGTGVTVEKFREALLSVGKGIKGDGSMGRFGLGLISPINKCRVFTFASQPVGERSVFCWTFVGKDIKEQHSSVTIPFEQRTKLPPAPRTFAAAVRSIGTQWRTAVHLREVTDQRVVSLVDLDELEGHIHAKLSQGMLQKGTTIHVMLVDENGAHTTRTIDPLTFQGERLETVGYNTSDTGKVRFELYRASKTGGRRRGRVLVMRMGDNRPISWRDFQTQAMGSRWLDAVKEAFAALGSGFFEGIIHIEKVVLDPTGSKFDTSAGDAVFGSYVVIQTWFDEYGKQYYEEERTHRREERYKSLGEQSLERLLHRFESDPAFAGMVRGLVGMLPEQDTPDPEPSVSRPSRPSSERAKPRKRTGATAKRPRQPGGTTPNKSRPVQAHATTFTISFAYEILPESVQLFEFDLGSGVLTFNILHPTWVALDETGGKHTSRNDKQIMQLQEWIVFKVLFRLSQHGEEDAETLAEAINAEGRYYAPLFIGN